MMIAIIMVLIALAMMAKARPRRRRRMGRYIRGNVDHLGDLSTLGGKVVIKFDFPDVVNERTWVSSAKLTWALSNLTEAFSAGPITCGLAHSDYTAAEIEVFLENSGQWDEGNLTSQEINKRKIRVVGTFDTPAQALGIVTLNDGKPITTKCGWVLLQGQTLSMWAYNSGSTALATTAAELTATGHANLWPR